MRIWAQIFRVVAIAALVLFLGACGGGSGGGPVGDFTLSVSPASLSAAQGSSGARVTVSVAGTNGFSGSVNVTLQNLPLGVAVSPGAPFAIAAGQSRDVTFSVSGVVPPGAYTLDFSGASGSLSHSAQLSFTVTVTPISVSTYQAGSVLYLETTVGEETARVGLESQWGGSVVAASLNGTEIVNRYDTGREVQASLYDGDDDYDNCAGCTGVFGWNPVQGGDRYVHGSPLLDQVLGPDSIYVKTQPYQWYPDDKGGGPSQPVLTDADFEQTLSPVAGHSRAFQLHYRLTHFGLDQHANSGQEFPAVYVNVGFERVAYYEGTSPWTNGAVTTTSFPSPPSPAPLLYVSEKWLALVDSLDFGLTVYVPTQYPYGAGVTFPGEPGPTGFGTTYYNPQNIFMLAPNSVFEGDIFIILGDYKEARPVVYDLHANLPAHDLCSPFGYVDAPSPNNTVSGLLDVTGWTFDDTAVSTVEVLVDGLLAGAAAYGFSRPDIPAAFPHAPENVGFQYSLNTAFYLNGSHLIQVRVTDTSGNVAVFRKVPVVISN